VRWAAGPDAPKDIEHYLVVLTARSSFLSVVATDKSLGARLTRGGSGKEWSTMHRVSFSRLERALVSGNTRTLWLSGIHRSVATKADSKVLIGPDVEASLDALGDQSYQYTSTRCAGPKALPASFVGVTPRMAKACRTRGQRRDRGNKPVYVLFYAGTYEEEKMRRVLGELVEILMYEKFQKFTLSRRWHKWLRERSPLTMPEYLSTAAKHRRTGAISISLSRY
jgi:hypothetical protein